jgi:hypothetical protein
LPGTEKEAFDNYLQAAIVFGRSVYHYLHSLAEFSGVEAAYRQWFMVKSTEMLDDPVLEFFRASRDLLLKERTLAVARRIYGTASVSAYISLYAEGSVNRGGPWHRRSPVILWRDAKAAVIRPVNRWLCRLGESLVRRRRVIRQAVEARRTRWLNRNVVPTVSEFYVGDPEGLDRPAVDLVRAYLDRLGVIIAEAETLFPAIVG